MATPNMKHEKLSKKSVGVMPDVCEDMTKDAAVFMVEASLDGHHSGISGPRVFWIGSHRESVARKSAKRFAPGMPELPSGTAPGYRGV